MCGNAYQHGHQCKSLFGQMQHLDTRADIVLNAAQLTLPNSMRSAAMVILRVAIMVFSTHRIKISVQIMPSSAKPSWAQM
ncbi:hypothetical protein [Snodgrassella gandavensis]|uniref:hypothetical protein n=1 Tax=Snodgrassella gandavensis TaxID=2946698 RepID=UPI001EF44B62|nr:hypothetical protein [Snodgrassella gandavensis]